MHTVELLYGGPPYQTEMWISSAVVAEFDGMDKKVRAQFLEKLRYYATGGFQSFTGGK